jgi:pimeloyl-ACP methyl ester carboxylesterase
VSKVDAMGWSWGTIIVAQYATEEPDKVNRLALYAPIWLSQEKPSGNKIGAYRAVTAEQARQRWLNGVSEDKKDMLIPPGWFDARQKATWATDAIGNARNPSVLRAPNGVVQEFEVHWRNGKPTYDPAKITMPTLLVRGEWIAMRRHI